MKRFLCAILIAALTLGLFSGLTVSAAELSSTVEMSEFAMQFQSPDAETKMKIRTWWPDAKATEADIRAEVRTIAAAGFGGIELIAIGTASDPANLGWGTDAWNQAMVWLLDEAEKEGILVDLTIGPRWPAAIPGLDPNDDLAQRKLIHGSTTQTITELGEKTFNLPDMPYFNDTAAVNRAEFIALVAAEYASVTDTISGTSVTRTAAIDENTLTVIPEDDLDLDNGTFRFTAPTEGNYIFFTYWAVGIGQTAGSTDPAAYVVSHFNKEGAEAVLNGWAETFEQYPAIKNHFETYGGSFFIDSLEMTGADIYWSGDMAEYFLENKGYDIVKYLPLIMRKGSANETATLTAAADITNGVNTIPAGTNYTLGESVTATGNPNAGDEVRLDFVYNLSDMFNKNHIDQIQKWCEQHNMNLRMQAQGTSGKGWNDALASQTYVGIPEGESLGMSSHPDAFRSLAGSSNMSGKTGLVSVELGADVGGAYRMTWQRLTESLNRVISGGANQMVLHGYPTLAQYTQSEAWPSWSPFTTMFAEPWNEQNPSWDYMRNFTDYASRLTTAMQYGTASVDFAVYRSNVGDGFYIDSKLRAGSDKYSGNNDPQQLYDYYTETYDTATNLVDDLGYTYNYISPESFDLPNSKVVNGVLNPDHAGYKALVIKDVNTMDLASAQAIYGYAEVGLPVILIGTTPDTGSATNIDKHYLTNDDEAVIQVFSELKALPNVKAIADTDELPGALAELNIESDASYPSNNIAAIHRTGKEMDLYYLFNNSTTRDYETNDFTHDNGESENVYHDPDKKITTTVTLQGNGKPYSLDPWTGEIAPVLEYTDNGDGTISIDITLLDSEVMLIGITAVNNFFGNISTPAVTNNSTSGEVLYKDNSIVYRTTEASTYDVTCINTRKAGDVESVAASITLDDGWTLEVESWEPGPLALLPTSDPDYSARDIAKVAMGPYTNVALQEWGDIALELENISGQGLYARTFNLDGNFTGAYLDLGKTYSNILEVKVNDQILPPVDQFNKIYDLGSYAQEGENSITILVGSVMDKAVKAAGRSFSRDYATAYPSEYGLLGGVTVTPYVDVVIASGDLQLSTDAYHVKRDGYANITTEFAEPVNSNTAILNYTFDTALFEFADFHPESNVRVISQEATETGAKVVVMVSDYNTQTYGRLAMHAKADAPLTRGWASVSSVAEYVVKNEDGEKEIKQAFASTSFTTLGNGLEPEVEGDTNDDGVVDLIDLSNMIDWFGIDSRDPEWDDWYTFFDYNNNGNIDIYDISFVAQLIK